MIELKDKFLGLYVALHDRAIDKASLDRWLQQADTEGDALTLVALASELLDETVETKIFVESIFSASVGHVENTSSIQSMIDSIDSGQSRAEVVVAFVEGLLEFNAEGSALTELEQESVLKNKAFLLNKVAVSNEYVNILLDKTNLDADLENAVDPAFLASIAILSAVTDDAGTVTSVIEGIALLADQDDAMSLINRAYSASFSDIIKGELSLHLV